MDEIPEDEQREPETGGEVAVAEAPPVPFRPELRPALEPTCCGAGCDDCPFL